MASTLRRSRPSEKLGTHSTSDPVMEFPWYRKSYCRDSLAEKAKNPRSSAFQGGPRLADGSAKLDRRGPGESKRPHDTNAGPLGRHRTRQDRSRRQADSPKRKNLSPAVQAQGLHHIVQRSGRPPYGI